MLIGLLEGMRAKTMRTKCDTKKQLGISSRKEFSSEMSTVGLHLARKLRENFGLNEAKFPAGIT